jgi:hypothetical protein
MDFGGRKTSSFYKHLPQHITQLSPTAFPMTLLNKTPSIDAHSLSIKRLA